MSESKRSPIFGRISVFTTVEDATAELTARDGLLTGAGKKNLYSVYSIPTPDSTASSTHFAVELNPINAIGSVAQKLGWVANKVGGKRAAPVTAATVGTHFAGKSNEEIDAAIKALKAQKS